MGDLKKDDKRDEEKVAQAVKDLKEDKKDEKEIDQKSSSGTKTEVKADKQKVALKDNANSKGGKLKDYERLKEDNKDKGEKDESWNKSNKEVKEKRKPEQPPRHPGLILKTKGNKEGKIGFDYCLAHIYVTNCYIKRHKQLILIVSVVQKKKTNNMKHFAFT